MRVATHSRGDPPAAPPSPLGIASARPGAWIVVVTGFNRTWVIDGVLEHSPAEHMRRPQMPQESPTLGLSHLQFDALLTAARESTNRCGFGFVATLSLSGLRIFEATGSNIHDLGEEHGHRLLRVLGKESRAVLVLRARQPRRPVNERTS